MISDEKKESGLPWLGFWLFMSVVVLLRPDLISHAFEHSDEDERTLTELKIEELRFKMALEKQGLTDKVNE